MEAITAFWVPFFGFLGACATVAIPLILRYYFNLASKRENENDKIARNYQVARDFLKVLWQRYDEDHGMIMQAYEFYFKRNHPEGENVVPKELGEYLLFHVASKKKLENEFEKHLESESRPARRNEDQDRE